MLLLIQGVSAGVSNQLHIPQGQQPLQLWHPPTLRPFGTALECPSPPEAPVVLEMEHCCSSSGALPLNHRIRLGATLPALRCCMAPLSSFSTCTTAGQSGKLNSEGLKSTWTTMQSRIWPAEDTRSCYCCLQAPHGRVERGWRQTLPRGAWAQTEAQHGRAAAGTLLTRSEFFP